MENRTKRMWIRLTPKEYELFKKKAASHQSVSSMVRDAVNCYNHVESVGKIAAIVEVSKILSNTTTELNHVGNNLNQIAHVLNSLMMRQDYQGAQEILVNAYNQIMDVMNEAMGKIYDIKQIKHQIYKRLL